MTTRLQRRYLATSGSVLRHVAQPAGTLAISWLVIGRTGTATWGACVSMLITIQLLVHLVQWGQRDLLLRDLSDGRTDASALWWTNLCTRVPLLSILLLPLVFFPEIPVTILLGWGLMAALSASLEPLVVHTKRFHQALLADVAGLLVQLAMLAASGTIDPARVVASFAMGQMVRAVGIWIAVGRPGPMSWRWAPGHHLAEAFPFVLIGLGGLLATRADLYTMAWLVDDDALGSYQVIAGLFLQLQVLPGLLVKPHLPALMRLGERSLIHHAARRLLLGALLAVPATMIVLYVLRTFFHVAPDLGVLLAGALSVVPASAYVVLLPRVLGLGQERRLMALSFLAAGVLVTISLVLVPFIGIAGGLWGTACAQWTILAGAWRFLMKRPPLWSADRQP
ncbi:MAG: polysaccharide biosynthesis C-terminal domain-containing protein [Flavobacteriales bacterium]